MEEVRSKISHEENDKLLTLIAEKPPEQFVQFLDALKITKQDDIYDTLRRPGLNLKNNNNMQCN